MDEVRPWRRAAPGWQRLGAAVTIAVRAMRNTRGIWPIAMIAALGGCALAFDAHRSGSLFRYRLVGYLLGAGLTLPLLSLLVWRAAAARLWRKVAFASVPTAAALLLAEGIARLVLPAPVTPARILADARLGHVIAPRTYGTDARGFRNPEVLDRADVLFVGDSQTWGFGVGADGTLPARFEQRTHARCYQMADSSYGPVQYRELVRLGLALQPQLVVVGFYFGNDLVDAHDYAALEGAEDLRTPGHEYRLRAPPAGSDRPAPNLAMALIDGAVSTSRLVQAATDALRTQLAGSFLDDQEGAVRFAHERVPALLLPAYRRPLIDPARPSVADGVQVTVRSLTSIAALCRARAAEPVLLAIPTKEYCYATWTRDPAPWATAFRQAEGQVRESVFAAARASGMRVVDLLPALHAAMHDGAQPWLRSGDGHLAAAGYELAAEQVAASWRR